MTEQLQKNGFSFANDKHRNGKVKQFNVSGRLSAAVRTLEGLQDLPWEENRDHAVNSCIDGSEEFCGGSLRDLKDALNGRIDMVPFNAAKERFQKSNIGQKLVEKYANCQPRRQRFMSEHDGEFEESRRWSVAPFQGVKRVAGPGRCVDIVAHGSVNCRTSAEQYQAFGCFVWALVEIIEGMGVNTRVVMRYKSRGLWGRDNDNKAVIDIECKKAGEYIAPSLLAAACTPNFFRRAIFAMYCALPDCISAVADYGLGQSWEAEMIDFKDGQVLLSPGANNASFEKIESVLLQAIT